MTFTFSRTVAPLLVVSLSALSHASVVLQNATATFSQAVTGPWNASEMIDGNLDGNNGWAIFQNSGADRTLAESAVFETASDLSAPGLSISMKQNYAVNPGHFVGRFRWSYTTDVRGDFADGLQNGGDVTANWVVMTPTSLSTPAGFSSSILGDGSVLMAMAGSPPATAEYIVNFGGALAGVTGLRFEVLPDTSLPTNGPGLFSNGNFVLTEVGVTAVPEPGSLLAFGLGLAAVTVRRRPKS